MLEEIKRESEARAEANRDDADESDDADEDSESEEDDETEQDPIDALIAELIPASELGNIPPPVPLIEGILDRNSLARVIGTSGHGKTFVMLDLAAHVASGRPWLGRECKQGLVVYMVAEGVSGIQDRVAAWEAHHGVELGRQALFLPRAVQVMSQLDWLIWVAAMERLKPAMIVMDTQARITVGADENAVKDMGVLVERADLLKDKTGACVVLVHHKGRQGDHGRGSTVVPAALDAEVSVTRQGKTRITILSEKQKDREDFEPISLELVKVGGSAVLVQPGTEHPFESNEINENSSARDRVAALLYRTFHEGNGATQAQVYAVVKERDRGTRGKPMAKSSFYKAWAELEGDGALVLIETEAGKRWELTEAEAARLGLRRPGDGSWEATL
jgi:RecA/RadA recombinase